jgi:hypothetical protein
MASVIAQLFNVSRIRGTFSVLSNRMPTSDIRIVCESRSPSIPPRDTDYRLTRPDNPKIIGIEKICASHQPMLASRHS